MNFVQKANRGKNSLTSCLLAPEIDLSAEFITTIWRDNDATESSNVATNIGTNDATDSGANDLTTNANSTTNIGTSENSVATDHLTENKRIVEKW